MKEIPVLDWHQVGTSFVAWINGTELYALKPVLFIGEAGRRLQWELRIECPQAGTVELLGVYDKDGAERAMAHARSHVGDDE